MDECSHPIRIGTLCGVCGMEIQEEPRLFCALYNTDNVKITHKEAVSIYKEKVKALEMQMKLILVLDLDQTVLHTTYGTSDCKGIVKFTMDGCKYSVKLRPHLNRMLRRVSKLYEIHVYTMGTRPYAERIIGIIDPAGKYFHDRIITRDENQGVLVKRLSRLFPYNHKNIVILDDRADVWDYNENLVLVKPFWYFNRVDINDPSKLERRAEGVSDGHGDLGEFVGKRKKVEEGEDARIISRPDGTGLGGSSGKPETEVDSDRMGEKKVREEPSDDCELLRMVKFLKKVHKKYFSSKHRNVKKILRRIRKRIFDGDRFFIVGPTNRAWLVKVIEMHGGMVSRLESEVDFVISSGLDEVRELAQKLECLVVSPKWIEDCVYSLERVGYGRYVICDYRVKDEYEEELEKLFG
ncbi:TFIIF-interacting CTD phosphatase [Encephalitozoon hellem ATCC 50504]|uniref:RNA polymerase II subunit A C-terminal domain phosphatase n=1 Tax=Encephalitozoon hellem TaxID=27973 RepID=A0A9Q9CAW6_ENCHE|nr:TFIIF-interacting CTD phosphatase [Encephalitozoon hellem ATCC 50504]AFM98613.1 TFIIF-interacting CTD phosphatase [Encephalitozoon hellem ATCC 50504]UTX43558.1 RNA polymerase II subunit A C-terminal domain phosphatase [Encephalitozoon hellem]|eukprot:XP_003887594.1 TFIIF-interacting CTD phosphatase [Encephalitozoon hellem ATCC 50504]